MSNTLFAVAGRDAQGQDRSANAMQDAARYMLRLRTAAKSCFGPPFVSDVGWSLILALYTADVSGKNSRIGTVAARADVPRTTALRWLTRLERGGFVSLSPDPSDKRAVRVRMTGEGRDAMERSFTASRFLT